VSAGPAARADADRADPRESGFYDSSVQEMARDLLGCTLRHGETAGRIVEVESYHEEEPACHAHTGLTQRTRVLFGVPGRAYVYRSYGIHALLNVVAEREGVGAAVLLRALEPIDGLELMRRRRSLEAKRDLCSGPGKLTQALGIGLELNGVSLVGGAIELEPAPEDARPPVAVTGGRIGITRAVELRWRICDATSDCVSRPLPPGMRRARGSRPRARAA
jgi:DNA-3-methyladenine glycosylase